jgi:hypothetical protein
MSRFDVLDNILSDFKVPRRNLELDNPIPIDEIKGNQDKVYDEVLNNDYLAFTRNLKIAKTIPLTAEEKLKKDELVNKVYNFEYRPNPDSKTDYDILKEGYELLYAVYLEQKRSLNNILADHMKLGVKNFYLKQYIENTLLEIKQNIEKRSVPDLIFELEASFTKIQDAHIKYIKKLEEAIGSVSLSHEQKMKLLYELLEIPKEPKEEK